MDWETTSSDADTECNGGARAMWFKQLALYIKSVAASSPFWCQHPQLQAEVAASIASFVGPKETAEADRQSCFQFKTSIHCKMEEDRCWMIPDRPWCRSWSQQRQLDQLAIVDNKSSEYRERYGKSGSPSGAFQMSCSNAPSPVFMSSLRSSSPQSALIFPKSSRPREMEPRRLAAAPSRTMESSTCEICKWIK